MKTAGARVGVGDGVGSGVGEADGVGEGAAGVAVGTSVAAVVGEGDWGVSSPEQLPAIRGPARLRAKPRQATIWGKPAIFGLRFDGHILS